MEEIQKALNFHLAHIGINQENGQEAEKTARILEALFGLPYQNGDASIFAGSQFEVMKSNFRGRNGHIAIGTANVQKAKTYLESKGILFDEKTAGYDSAGNLTVIYFKDEIAGFAFHLLQHG
jgi:2-dehydro-3-deoxyphosphogluconate aldolase/(4S)-4-hydroxy-2-oxoglutarate aldolase